MRKITNLRYAIALAVVVYLMWDMVTRQRYGGVIVTIAPDRGLHVGDVPVVLIGGVICGALLYRVASRGD